MFINFVKSLPKESLRLHFHCAAGEGRSTTFLVMYDMMRNSTKVKLQDIFLRQYLLGGINFLNETSNDWRKNYLEERKTFLGSFMSIASKILFSKNHGLHGFPNKKRKGEKITKFSLY